MTSRATEAREGPGATVGQPATVARRRRRIVAMQRWVLNPLMRRLVWLGLVPGHVVVETRGRRTGKRRRTVVGALVDGDSVWIVAEQGRHAGWVLNLEAEPAVRVRHRARWRAATASVVDGDDPQQRLRSWKRPGHARLVRSLGTDLRTIHVALRRSDR